LRRHLGPHVVDRVLDRRDPGDRQLVHLRGQPAHLVPDRRARRLAAPPRRVRRPAGLRLLPARLRAAREADAVRPAPRGGLDGPGRRPPRLPPRPRRLARGHPPPPEHRIVTSSPLISLTDVAKSFTVYERAGRVRRRRRTVHAVDHVSFRVEAGSTVGYIGPNGAGKSTTIKMLIGILVPTRDRKSVV